MKNNFEYVVTHDAARPNVCENDISRLCDDIAKSKSSCSYLYTPVYDSIREDDRTLDKSKFNLVQTPQICNFKDLKKSIQKFCCPGSAWELGSRSHLPAAAQNLHFAAKLQ